MTTDPVTDVVVIGGGPAGSATALRLARAGHRVAVFDRAAFPRDKACSEYMSPETVRHLDLLGVLPTIEGKGAAPTGTRVSGPSGSALTGEFSRSGGTPFRSSGLSIARRILDAALLDAAARHGAVVHQQHRVADLLRGPGGEVAGVRVSDGARTFDVPARVVVAADGLHSFAAARMALRAHGALRRTAFVAHLRGVTDVSAITELHVDRQGYVGINDLGHGVANVAVVVPACAARAAAGDATRFFLAELRRRPAVAERVARAEIVRDVMATGPFDVRSRRSTADGLLLVGDAADFFDPFTGEGICCALQGAELAAAALDPLLATTAPVTDRALGEYRRARRRAFLGKWIIERLIGYGMLAPALFDRAVARLERRGMADTLIGVTGHFVSPWQVLNPVYLTRMLV